MFGLVQGTASSEDTRRWEQGLCKPTGANPASCIPPPQLKVAKISLRHGPRCLLYDYAILTQWPKEGSLHDEQSSLWTWFHIEWITTEEPCLWGVSERFDEGPKIHPECGQHHLWAGALHQKDRRKHQHASLYFQTADVMWPSTSHSSRHAFSSMLDCPPSNCKPQ